MQVTNVEVLNITPSFFGYSVDVHAVVDGTKMHYTIRTKLSGFSLEVDDVGFKSSRKKIYTYVEKLIQDNATYRSASKEQRRVMHRECLAENVPVEVVREGLAKIVMNFVAEPF